MWKLRYDNDIFIISILLPYLKKLFNEKNHTLEINQINIAKFLCFFLIDEKINNTTDLLDITDIIDIKYLEEIKNKFKELNLDFPNNINKKYFIIIQNNKILNNNLYERNIIINFGHKVKDIQNYFYFNKNVGVCKLLGKLLTRIFWIHFSSSPVY